MQQVVREWDKRTVEKEVDAQGIDRQRGKQGRSAYFMNPCAIEGCGTARSSNKYIV
jgi:hypothetical protein